MSFEIPENHFIPVHGKKYNVQRRINGRCSTAISCTGIMTNVPHIVTSIKCSKNKVYA
jgi:hypothetical protein